MKEGEKMQIDPITILLIGVFLYPIIKGFVFEFSSNNIKNDIEDIEGDIGFILSLIIGLIINRKIFIQHETGLYKQIYDVMPDQMITLIEDKPSLIYIIILPIIILILFSLVKLSFIIINNIIIYPLIDNIEAFLKNKTGIHKRITGALFEVPKAICYILLVSIVINIVSIFNFSSIFNSFSEKSKLYNYICKNVVLPITNSKLAMQLPSIINNSFKIEERQNTTEVINNKQSKTRTIVYYNGVTLEEGIKSNEQIDEFAKKLVVNDNSDKLKAKRIYNWIGSNISYDHDKANKVLNNNFDIKSGAIQTYIDKKGICFDYSCLYVAMCRANGLKVRLVTGEGFNGVSWVSHAWNEVYIESEDKWISVDSTFYKGGNYFNSKRFDIDHKNAKIVGEW